MHEYYTGEDNLILREYGRNIHKLVKFIKNEEDRDTRNRYAHTLVELMKQINPGARENAETDQKLWDDIYIMADFDIDIDGPFPKPSPEIIHKKPERLPYNTNKIHYRHYGYNIELLVEEALKEEEEEKRKEAFLYIGRLMKSFYSSWNKDNIDDGVILENLKKLSNGKFDMDLKFIQDNNLFETIYRDRSDNRGSGGGGGGRRGKRSGKRRRNN